MRPRDAEAATLGRSEVGDIDTAHMNLAGRRPISAGEHVQEGGLAGPVRANDADRLAGADREIDAVQNDQRSKPFAKSGASEKRIASGHALHPLAPESHKVLSDLSDGALTSAVVGHEFGADRNVRIVGVVGDDHIELEFAARLGVHPLGPGEDHRVNIREGTLGKVELRRPAS